MLTCRFATCRTLRLFAEPPRVSAVGFKQVPSLIRSRKCMSGCQVQHVVFPREEFQHILQDVGRVAAVYAGHPLSGMSPCKRGMFLKGLCKSVLTSASPHLQLEEPVPGTSVNGQRRSEQQASWDWTLGGRKVQCKTARLVWLATDRTWSVNFGAVKFAEAGTRTNASFDDLYLVLDAPDSVHILKHDLRTGVVRSGKQTAARGHRIVVRGKMGTVDWRPACETILQKLCVENGQCETIEQVFLADRRLQAGLCQAEEEDLYQRAPLSHATPSFRAKQIETMGFEIDQKLNPASTVIRQGHASPFGWIRDSVRVELKHGRLVKTKDGRWRCSFSNIQCAKEGVRETNAFDELWLALYSPVGIDFFQTSGQLRYSSVGVRGVPMGNDIVLTVPGRGIELLEALCTFRRQLEQAGCHFAASVPWTTALRSPCDPSVSASTDKTSGEDEKSCIRIQHTGNASKAMSLAQDYSNPNPDMAAVYICTLNLFEEYLITQPMAGFNGPWKPAKLAREQKLVFLTGAGKQSGVFVEIVTDSELSPVFRKLEASGTWSDTVAIFATSRWRITTDLSGAKCFLRSQKLASIEFHGLTWEKRQGKSWVEIPEASFRLGLASELEASLRPVAREALRLGLKEHVRMTQFRCTADDCPKGCGNSLAKDWGLPSLSALLGHLAFYHRSSTEYHEKVNEVWDQELADELEQREEGEELLRLFAASLTEHRYDLKSQTVTPNTHCRNIRFIAEKLGCEVSRSLAGDDEVYEQVRKFPEDQKRHRHYSVSLGWLRKFAEVNALEAALSLDTGTASVKRRRVDHGLPGGHRQQRQHSAASTSECPLQGREVAASGDAKCSEARAAPTEVSEATEDPAVESTASAAQEKRRSPVAQAADPTERLCHRGAAGAGTRGSADAAAHKGAAHELAASFAEIASGDALAAKRIAESLEPKMNAELISQTPPSLHSWLWAYSGASDSGRRAAVLKLLCAGTMRSSRELRSLNGALQKLLVVALSPLGAATDVLPAVAVLSDMPVAEASENDISLSKLTFFANKGFVFQQLLGERGSGFSCGCVQFASFGGLLGRMCRSSAGEDQRRHLQELCTFRSDTTYQAWHYRVSFLSALLWNMGGPTAFKE
ncbi:unnamed protein product, partial [Symbiodinium microadriaticum]